MILIIADGEMLMVDKVQLIKRLEGKILELRQSLPAPSIPASMLIELEDLEEQLGNLQVDLEKESDAPA